MRLIADRFAKSENRAGTLHVCTAITCGIARRSRGLLNILYYTHTLIIVCTAYKVKRKVYGNKPVYDILHVPHGAPYTRTPENPTGRDHFHVGTLLCADRYGNTRFRGGKKTEKKKEEKKFRERTISR